MPGVVSRLVILQLLPYHLRLMTLQLPLDTYCMVRSTFATDGHRGGEDRARTALTLDPYALRTPRVGSGEWHFLDLVMILEVLDDLHRWPPLLSPTGDSSSRLCH